MVQALLLQELTFGVIEAYFIKILRHMSELHRYLSIMWRVRYNC